MKFKVFAVVAIFAIAITVVVLGNPDRTKKSEDMILKDVGDYLELVDKNIVSDSLREAISDHIRFSVKELSAQKNDDPNVEKYMKIAEYIEGGRETGEVRKLYSELGGE